MPHFILYTPAGERELYQCCFSLLKLLEVYNLKPPAVVVPVVCTDRPAGVEAFTSFFHDFRILPPYAPGLSERLKAEGTVLQPRADEYFAGPLPGEGAGSGWATALATYQDIPPFAELVEAFLRKYQEESIPNQVKRVHGLPIDRIREESRRFSGLPLHQRWLRRLMGREWSVRRAVEKL